jgi:uncharacterized OB-fold protein
MEKPSAGLWRKIKPRYNLIGTECQNCGASYFPPRIVCRRCGRASKMVEKKFAGEGEVYSYTRIMVPPDTFKDEAPYFVGMIKLDEGPMVEGHILDDGSEVKIGMRVRTSFRKMHVEGEEGLIYYHYKFEPA